MDWWKKRKRTRTEARRRVGPVILPRVIEAFLTRELEDYSWIKQCPREELYEDIPEGAFHTEPRLHQLACYTLGRYKPQFLFLLDMGAGKTKIILDIFRHRKLEGKVRRLLVLVPSAVNADGWMEQIAEHTPDLKGLPLLGDKAERLELLKEEADVFLLNYDGLQSYVTSLSGKKREGRIINYSAAHKFARLFDMVVFDESHLIGNKKSLRFRMCNILSDEINYRYAMTGTPFGRDPEKLWAQFYLVDRGETLGTTLGLFRAAFFTAKENYWGGIDYTFDKSKEQLLHRMIQHRSIRYNELEFSDMPKISRQVHRLSFPGTTEEYYNKVLAELRQSKGDVRAIENAFIRMRQVTAGFLRVSDDEGNKSDVRFYSNPKLEQLETLLDGVIEEEKVIVFHEYIPSGDMICSMLDTKKIKYARVGGKVKDPVASMKRFMEREDCRVLVMNYKSGGGAGLNLQKVCRRLVYYESPVSPIVRKQTEKRISGGLRTGKHRVFIHDLVIANSVDETILRFLKQGKDLFDAICEGKVAENELRKV
ncbi:MAG: DEAD/DEAH box helicase [candidate division WOR-3 bacterium]